MNEPLISVLIAAYNAEKYLSEALDSVYAQDYCPIEVVLVDDGSTDGTAAVARRYTTQGLQYHHQSNQGVAATRNACLSFATGEFIAFIDADDIWLPGKLSSQMAAIEQRPEADVISGKIKQFISPELDAAEFQNVKYVKEETQSHMISACLFRRAVFDQVGPFDVHKPSGVDMDWVRRAKQQDITFSALDQLVYQRRLHHTNLGRNRSAENYQLRFRILKEAIDDQRKPKP